MSRFLAIDIDPQGLHAVLGTARGGAIRIERTLSWGDDGPLPPLTVDSAKAIGEQLRDRLKAARMEGAPALVAIGRDKVILKEVRFPTVPPSEEPALVRFQATKEITDAPEDVVVDYAPTDTDAGDGRRATAVIVRKDVFAAVQAMCTAAGLKLVGVTPRPFAVAAGLTRAYATGAVPPPERPGDADAALTFGTSGGEFTVVRSGQVTFTRTIPAPVLVSEQLLLAEVRRNLAVYASQNPAQPVQAVYVAEAEAGTGGWAGRLRAALAIPVHPFDPLAGADPGIPVEVRGRFAGAAGLLAGKAADALPINFVSPRQPKAQADPKKRQMILAALAALLLVGAGLVYGYLTLQSAETKLANLRREKQELENELANTEVDGKRLDAVDNWSNREISWLDELFDMTDRFPKGDTVRVNEFKGAVIAPDPKTGKQVASGTIDVFMGAKTPDPTYGLRAALDRDSTNPKVKYYVGSTNTTNGQASGNTPYKEFFKLHAQINRRPPTEYTRLPAFTAPSRKIWGGPTSTDETTPTPTTTEPTDPTDPGDGNDN